MVAIADVSTLPLAPKNPLPHRQLVKLVRSLNTGQEVIRDAGGPVTRIKFGPKWLVPPIVAVTSPDGIRDVLGRSHGSSERCIIHKEVRNMAGDSLFVLPTESWLPRKRALQPVFTKHNVRDFGGQMSRAAETFVAHWRDGGTVDLDVECRRLTMRSLGRSVLGVDLNERADVIIGERLAGFRVGGRNQRVNQRCVPVRIGTARLQHLTRHLAHRGDRGTGAATGRGR